MPYSFAFRGLVRSQSRPQYLIRQVKDDLRSSKLGRIV